MTRCACPKILVTRRHGKRFFSFQHRRKETPIYFVEQIGQQSDTKLLESQT